MRSITMHIAYTTLVLNRDKDLQHFVILYIIENAGKTFGVCQQIPRQ